MIVCLWLINRVKHLIPGFDMDSGNFIGVRDMFSIMIFGVLGTSFHPAALLLFRAIPPAWWKDTQTGSLCYSTRRCRWWNGGCSSCWRRLCKNQFSSSFLDSSRAWIHVHVGHGDVRGILVEVIGDVGVKAWRGRGWRGRWCRVAGGRAGEHDLVLELRPARRWRGWGGADIRDVGQGEGRRWRARAAVTCTRWFRWSWKLKWSLLCESAVCGCEGLVWLLGGQSIDIFPSVGSMAPCRNHQGNHTRQQLDHCILSHQQIKYSKNTDNRWNRPKRHQQIQQIEYSW